MNRTTHTIRRHTLRALLAALCIAPLGLQGAARADAPLKIFLTASAEERARRRYLQLKGKGDDVNLASLLDEIRARDERDTQRAVAPLKPAADAIVCTMLFSTIEWLAKLRSTAIEMTAAGIAVAKVRPTLRPR